MNFSTELLGTENAVAFQEAARRAAELLEEGEVVALPTETVYGLAANALNPVAVRKLFVVKERPAANPVIVHVDSLAQARECAGEWPAVADALAGAFWPGPLTLVVRRSDRIPDLVTAGGETVGLRWPSHPFIREVIRRCGFPLAAPSANPSNQVSPTNAAHVLRHLRGKIPLVVDGGQSQVGIESTVVDVSSGRLVVLRPGMIHWESLRAVVPDAEWGVAGSGDGVLRSPGLLERHYAPRARLVIWRWGSGEELSVRLRAETAGQVQVIAHTQIPLHMDSSRVSVIPHDAEAFARALYAELHRCDEAGADWIVVEEVPLGAEWAGVADRLRRAAAGSAGKGATEV